MQFAIVYYTSRGMVKEAEFLQNVTGYDHFFDAIFETIRDEKIAHKWCKITGFQAGRNSEALSSLERKLVEIIAAAYGCLSRTEIDYFWTTPEDEISGSPAASKHTFCERCRKARGAVCKTYRYVSITKNISLNTPKYPGLETQILRAKRIESFHQFILLQL
jgi:hypothetical protein